MKRQVFLAGPMTILAFVFAFREDLSDPYPMFNKNMLKRVYLLFSIVGLLSCSHLSGSNSFETVFDSDLILPWSVAQKNISTAKSPALYEFSRGDKKLWYLASQHSTKLESPSFSFIKWIFENKKIDAVVVEGFSDEFGINPEAIRREALRRAADGSYPNGEPSYVIEIASSKSVPFIGGEPGGKAILKMVLEKGFSESDLLSFEFVRRMPQIHRSGDLEKKSLEVVYREYVESKAKDYQMKSAVLTFDKFKEWYLRNQGKEFTVTAGELGETAPIEGGPFLTQKISQFVTKSRDANILATVSRMLNKHQNVLVVYGSSHFRIQYESLKKSLGSPLDISPF